MAKIIITERQYNLIKEHLSEDIDPGEAFNHPDALATVVNGRRNVGFYGGATIDDVKALKASGLKFFALNVNDAYVFYRDGYGDDAMKLAKIARKHGGFLKNETPEEAYEIGMLLGYREDKVKKFVQDNFPDFKFY